MARTILIVEVNAINKDKLMTSRKFQGLNVDYRGKLYLTSTTSLTNQIAEAEHFKHRHFAENAAKTVTILLKNDGMTSSDFEIIITECKIVALPIRSEKYTFKPF